MKSLEEKATFPPSHDVEVGMEKLDNMIEEIMLQSEQECRNSTRLITNFPQQWRDG
jgi:hypothetical protein